MLLERRTLVYFEKTTRLSSDILAVLPVQFSLKTRSFSRNKSIKYILHSVANILISLGAQLVFFCVAWLSVVLQPQIPVSIFLYFVAISCLNAICLTFDYCAWVYGDELIQCLNWSMRLIKSVNRKFVF